ncbi:MAG: c-type cytochrome [Pseudomonadota bacterium]
MTKLLLFLSCLVYSLSANATDNSFTQPTLDKGATVFKNRCTLCHGNLGMGEGLLAMAIDKYPDTNLLNPKLAIDDRSLRSVIIWGGVGGHATEFSPPWGNELTWTKIESVLIFIKYLRNDTEKAIKLLAKQSSSSKPSIKMGAPLFQRRCAQCHGKTGEGDGKMAKIIKKIPPYNLTKSTLSDKDLRQIISLGGAAIQRSPQMPPWGDELSSTELESVILYIKTLRTQ